MGWKTFHYLNIIDLSLHYLNIIDLSYWCAKASVTDKQHFNVKPCIHQHLHHLWNKSLASNIEIWKDLHQTRSYFLLTFFSHWTFILHSLYLPTNESTESIMLGQGNHCMQKIETSLYEKSRAFQPLSCLIKEVNKTKWT